MSDADRNVIEAIQELPLRSLLDAGQIKLLQLVVYDDLSLGDIAKARSLTLAKVRKDFRQISNIIKKALTDKGEI